MGFGRFEIFQVYSFGRCPALIPQSLWFTTRTIHSFIQFSQCIKKRAFFFLVVVEMEERRMVSHMKERQQMGLKRGVFKKSQKQVGYCQDY